MSKRSESELRRRLDLLSGIEPSPQATGLALDRVRRTLAQAPTRPIARFASFWRIIMASKMTKLTAVAAMLLVALVLWQSMTFTGNAYALSDVPDLLGRARTIHTRTRYFSAGQELISEYWSDLETGRMYRYKEGLRVEEGPDGGQIVKDVVETVCDGQFVMRVDRRHRTVEFERLLISVREPRRLVVADRASNATLQDIRNFDQYVRAGKGEIEGERYDIWRRELRMANYSQTRLRHDYWVSPTTGAVGRMMRWVKSDRNREWELFWETDRFEIDVEPPAGIFLTEPPAGYAMENSRTTAEVVGLDLDAFRSMGGHTLRAPASFTLEDGSVLVCWRGIHDSAGAGPEALYENLAFGGDVPAAPAELFALMSHRDENNPGPMIHYVGRHVAVSRKEDRVYEWALYVPQQEVAVTGVASYNVAFIRLNSPPSENPMLEPSWLLTSFVVNPQSFAQYVPAAVGELSDVATMPAEIAYDNLLTLANQVRGRADLYQASQNAVEETRKRIGVLVPVEPEEVVTPEQVGRQAKQLVEAFYAAIVAGRDADAVKMLRYEEPRASRVVNGMKELPGVKDIEVEDIYATEENALVITNEFPVYEGRSGRWAIAVRKEEGTWRIGDFDATTTDRMHEEINEYLGHFPNAKHFSQ